MSFVIKNKTTYHRHLLVLMAITTVVIVALGAYSHELIASLVVAVIVNICYLGDKFTATIEVNDRQVVIVYHQWLTEKKIIFQAEDIRFRSVEVVTLRGFSHMKLDVYEKDTLVYSIDRRDGFDDDELRALETGQATQQRTLR